MKTSSPSVEAIAMISPEGATMQVRALLLTRFRDADHVHAVLVAGRLHHEMVMERAEVIVDRLPRYVCGRIVAEHDDFGALQRHYPIGFRPSSVIADRHADAAAGEIPDAETIRRHVEITLFQVLVRHIRAMIGMSGQMHLAIFADDLAQIGRAS